MCGAFSLCSVAFSSLQTKSLRPIIDSRAYILPTAFIESAKETITEKGITSKHVLGRFCGCFRGIFSSGGGFKKPSYVRNNLGFEIGA